MWEPNWVIDSPDHLAWNRHPIAGFLYPSCLFYLLSECIIICVFFFCRVWGRFGFTMRWEFLHSEFKMYRWLCSFCFALCKVWLLLMLTCFRVPFTPPYMDGRVYPVYTILTLPLLVWTNNCYLYQTLVFAWILKFLVNG